ncbi:Nif3-like dinuclear metal center hexameric protein [Adhaeribacter radiodurans]|uniref:GTP cyclohydrolase 1 type 2 homolog n=1 Tax=Adhaeribacter radiodurans TaxID=2745197 RepID=A0A7L7L6A4_9BACT|nr:Nif3-like dinuclear metal center hexameric protein [Adhaeribacter radiodurans]QMU28284.1 Nif3-like dinuclear metal center hexameric protein [Adhaeribacter radiodurans]
MTKIREITNLLEKSAPLSYQESYDNAGLQTGNPADTVTGVLLTLDCTEEVIEEALANNCNLIVAHHPVIFKPLKKLTGQNSVERVIIKALQNNLAIYACHTNLDSILTGVNDKICEKLGLQNRKILAPKSGLLRKLITFVPVENTETVLQALHMAGAGNIGDYKSCSFQVTGTGSFQPTGNANPAIGEINKQEYVNEDRIEVIFPTPIESTLLNALRESHPYEEVAYDIIPLTNLNQEVGAGMIGELPESLPEKAFIEHLKQSMNLNLVKHTRFRQQNIKRVAVCGGTGSFLIKDAIRQQADVFITADLKYHEYFDAENKIILADIGHYESEVFTKELFYDIIKKSFTNFAVLLSKVNTNPVSYS